MNCAARKNLVIKHSLMTGGFILLYWTTWHLIYGPAPTTLGIPRWWDVLIVPVLSSAIILFFTSKNTKGDSWLVVPVIIFLSCLMTYSLVYILTYVELSFAHLIFRKIAGK